LCTEYNERKGIYKRYSLSPMFDMVVAYVLVDI
jgi:hypothetical protein